MFNKYKEKYNIIVTVYNNMKIYGIIPCLKEYDENKIMTLSEIKKFCNDNKDYNVYFYYLEYFCKS